MDNKMFGLQNLILGFMFNIFSRKHSGYDMTCMTDMTPLFLNISLFVGGKWSWLAWPLGCRNFPTMAFATSSETWTGPAGFFCWCFKRYTKNTKPCYPANKSVIHEKVKMESYILWIYSTFFLMKNEVCTSGVFNLSMTSTSVPIQMSQLHSAVCPVCLWRFSNWKAKSKWVKTLTAHWLCLMENQIYYEHIQGWEAPRFFSKTPM